MSFFVSWDHTFGFFDVVMFAWFMLVIVLEAWDKNRPSKKALLKGAWGR